MPLEHIPCASSNDGEIVVRNYLWTELAHTDGILLTNYHHPLYNGTREHDLVLIHERGVWCLEVKNWYGPIYADQVYWLRSDGYRPHSPLTSVEIKAKLLAETLQNAGFENISVVGMIVLAQPENVSPLYINDPREHKVFRLAPRLIHAITGSKYLYRRNNKMLSPALMKQIADMLMPRTVDPRDEIIHNYRLVRDLGEGELYHAYEGLHTTIPERRARIKKYYIPDITSTKELQEAKQRFQQDMLALSKVDNHPNIVRIYDYQSDPHSNDTYWLFLEWIKGLNLQDRLDYDMPITMDEQLHILRSLVAALGHCHGKGILHRNLNPSSIYLAVDGTVKLGDFDYARVVGMTISKIGEPLAGMTISKIGEPLAVNKYTAPELTVSARDADVRSDLYSLGALWYDMALRLPADEPILISRFEEAALPGDAVELLQHLLEPRQDDRPKNVQEVKDRLRRL
jgi:tRNA A-37 threonylcarbamoyl transferase component Bud32